MAIKPKLPSGKGSKYTGEIKGEAQPGDRYAKPMEEHSDVIRGLGGTYDDIGEKSGFDDSGYLVKKGTPYGEQAKFNYLPPGMEIDNQENKDIRAMPFKELTDMSYPGDGWEPAPRKGE